MTNLIQERDERTKKRKKQKRKMDSIIGLSKDGKAGNVMRLNASSEFTENRIRLLDEGYFDNGFVIKKGTLEKYLNGENQYVRGYEFDGEGYVQTEVLNLTDDFIGNVNLGHMDFSTFPFVLGEWTREDLTLVDTENDRKGLDINVRLDEDSIFVQEFKRQSFDIGISSEFYYHINEEDTESLSEMLGYHMPVIDEVFIFAYGLVGECGNVNSSGLELKGVAMSKDIEKLTAEQVEVELETNAEEVTEAIEEIEEKLDEIEETKELGAEEIDITVNEEEELEAEESTDEENTEVEEETAELSEGDAEEEEEVTESDNADDEEDEVEEVESDDALDDEDEVDEADGLKEALAYIKALKAENEGLKEIIAELKKKNRKNANKLKKELEAKAEFLAMAKGLSVELFENEGEAEKQKEEEAKKLASERNYLKGDGIAD